MTAVIPVMILLPVLGVVLIGLTPARRTELFRPIAATASAATAAVAGYMLTQFDTGDPGYQFVVDRSWISDLGISMHFGIDGISLFLVMLSAGIFLFAILGASPHHDPKPYYAWLLVLQAGSIGVFTALDLVMFFVFFEIVLVPMYFLIGMWGHGRRTYAALKFFLFTMFGSALLLVGIFALAVLQSNATGEALTFDIPTITENLAVSTTAGRWLFVAFAVAFAIKVPLFPLHTWLPDAHTEAPTAGSVILAAVLLKFGTYGLLRLGIQLFPEASVWAAPVMMTLGVIGITYGAIVAAMQKDLKRVIAYSSVAHLGFIVLGMFSLTTQGIEGGLLIMVNHGIATGALFLLVGMIYERRHTREIAALSGMQKAAPILAAVFTISMLASVGLPGLNGFPGEFLSLLGAFSGARWWGVAAVTGIIFAAIYLLWTYQRIFHGPATGDNATMRDLRPAEIGVMVPLLALMVFLGIYPAPLLERMEPSVQAVMEHVEESVPGFHAPDPGLEPRASGSDASATEEGGH
jgi:NADH-quinone oxidoreductase subunit M